MQKSDQPKLTCGAVVKRWIKEKICSQPAVDLVTLVDPDDPTTVTATILVCKRHSKDLDSGKQLIFIAEDENGELIERITVQFSRLPKQ